MEDPQPVDEDVQIGKVSVTKNKRNRYLKGAAAKGYTKATTPLSYSQQSSLRANKYNPLTRVKPLIPNILDKMLIDSVNMDAASKRASGYKWSSVKER
jgi:hypothetical protein